MLYMPSRLFEGSYLDWQSSNIGQRLLFERLDLPTRRCHPASLGPTGGIGPRHVRPPSVGGAGSPYGTASFASAPTSRRYTPAAGALASPDLPA